MLFRRKDGACSATEALADYRRSAWIEQGPTKY
jgi:hypothetical protein